MKLGIYIHLPYCLTKCPYCDFNSYGVGEDFPEEQYTKAILSEIDMQLELLEKKEVSSIFFGGGTPSLFKPSSIELVLDKINSYMKIKKETEITLEINPRSVELEKLNDFRGVGINRASIGIQSFSDRKLKFYGRNSNSEDSRKVLEDINKSGFKNFNIDLIYGSTNETLTELENDLDIALEYGSTHISAYCLTIEDGTQFGYLYKKGLLKLPDDEVLSEMYTLTSEMLVKNGFTHYEISNFSKLGNECVQNLIYWKCDTYIGFGAGAHSHLKGYGEMGKWGKRWGNIKNPGKYMNNAINMGNVAEFMEDLDRENAINDKIMMGLRLSDGVDIENLSDIYNAEFNFNNLNHFFEEGLLEFIDGELKITKEGRIFSNLLIEKVTESLKLLN